MESNCGDLAQSPESDWTFEKTIEKCGPEILIDLLENGAEVNPDLWERGQKGSARISPTEASSGD